MCKEKGSEAANTPCLLCPNIGGIMKPTSKKIKGERMWVHLTCAYWVPEISFGNVKTKEPIEGFERINIKKSEHLCSICRIKCGVCISCNKSSCSEHFHAECGRIAGLHAESLITKGQEVIYKMYCERHRPLRALRTIEVGRKRAAEEVLKFAGILKNYKKSDGLYLKRQVKKKRDRMFSKADLTCLLKNVKTVCGRLNQFSVLIEKSETEGDNYKLLPTFFETRYAETLREGFPWESVKFGKFTAGECRRAYIQTIPNEATFQSKVMHKRNKSFNDLHKPIIDTTYYCKCHKQYHEDKSAMIGNVGVIVE